MYKKLDEAIKSLRVKKKDVSLWLEYPNQKRLSERLHKTAKFTNDEKALLWAHLRDPLRIIGWTGQLEDLFEYTVPPKKKPKKKTEFSSYLNFKIKDLGLTNQKLSIALERYTHKKVSENTISLWRSGKTMPDRENLLALCQYFKISPRRCTMRHKNTGEGFLSTEVEEFLEDEDAIFNKIFDLIVKYQKLRGYGDEIESLSDDKKRPIKTDIMNFMMRCDDFFDEHCQEYNLVKLDVIDQCASVLEDVRSFERDVDVNNTVSKEINKGEIPYDSEFIFRLKEESKETYDRYIRTVNHYNSLTRRLSDKHEPIEYIPIEFETVEDYERFLKKQNPKAYKYYISTLKNDKEENNDVKD